MARLLAPFAILAALAALSMGTVKVVEIVGPKPPRRAPHTAPSASARADVASVLDGGAAPRFEIPGERLSLGSADDALAPVLPELGADF